MTVKAIFFDFDDTLGDRITYATQCYREILRENHVCDDPLLLETMVQDCMIWDEFGNIPKRHVEEMLRKTYGVVLPYENFAEYWVEKQWHYAVPFADSEETLQELQKRYRLGIITNGPGRAQRMKLVQSGLKKYFSDDHIIVSGEIGIQKPDPGIFLEACRRLNVEPAEAVHVGDLYGRDVIGALKAGMQAVWMVAQSRREGGGDVLKIVKIKDLLDYF